MKLKWQLLFLAFFIHRCLNSLTCIYNLLHKQKLELFLAVNALHMCLACCQINKGARRPQVKQHTFPYCDHMSVCRRLYTHSHHYFPSAAHLCHTWRDTDRMWRLFSVSRNSWLACVTKDLCTFIQCYFPLQNECPNVENCLFAVRMYVHTHLLVTWTLIAVLLNAKLATHTTYFFIISFVTAAKNNCAFGCRSSHVSGLSSSLALSLSRFSIGADALTGFSISMVD